MLHGIANNEGIKPFLFYFQTHFILVSGIIEVIKARIMLIREVKVRVKHEFLIYNNYY